MQFRKMEATGNDFVLLEAAVIGEEDWGAWARWLCDRHFGIGADGLLVTQKLSPPRQTDRGAAHFRMRMFNPDGSEDMCGNGLRCVAAYLYSSGQLPARSFLIDTLTGPHEAVLTVKEDGLHSIQVNLGPPVLSAREIPVAAEGERIVDYPLELEGQTWHVTALSTGTPHAVIFHEAPLDFDALAPRIMAHPFFPQQASVSFAQTESQSRLRVRVWERGGVGESLSCGTGAAAVLAAAHLKGLTAREAEVIFRGGTLRAHWDCNGDLWIAGPARPVFSGRLSRRP